MNLRSLGRLSHHGGSARQALSLPLHVSDAAEWGIAGFGTAGYSTLENSPPSGEFSTGQLWSESGPFPLPEWYFPAPVPFCDVQSYVRGKKRWRVLFLKKYPNKRRQSSPLIPSQRQSNSHYEVNRELISWHRHVGREMPSYRFWEQHKIWRSLIASCTGILMY